MNENWNALSKFIIDRRSIKPNDFTGETVPDEIIVKLLELANWAPTHGYTEPWRFTIITGDGLARLGEFYANLDQPNQQAKDFNQLRYDRFRNRPMNCSHVIGIGMVPGTNPKIPELEELCATAMAVQNFWLGLEPLGLAGYWSTGTLAFTDEMRAFLGFSEGAKSLGLFYIGKPSIPHPKGRRLTPIGEKLNWMKS